MAGRYLGTNYLLIKVGATGTAKDRCYASVFLLLIDLTNQRAFMEIQGLEFD